MLERLVTLTRILAISSGAFIVMGSPPVRRSARAIRRSARALGPATFLSTLFVVGMLVLLLLSSAFESRLPGPSPFGSLPVVGQIVDMLSQGDRLAIALIVLSVTALVWGLTVRMPTIRAVHPGRRRLALPLWLAWLVVSALATWLAAPRVGSEVLTLYLATVACLLAVIVSVPLIDREVAVRFLEAIFAVATAATYGSILLSPDWAWTRDWPGGFIDGRRLQGIFPQPNVTGVFYGLGVLVVLSRKDIRLRTRVALAAPMLVLVYLSGSRGTVLLLLAGGLALTWGQGSIRRLRILVLASAAACIALPVLDLGTTQGALASRAAAWRIAYDIGRQSPILGGGSFPLRTPSGSSGALYAHNQLLQTFAETGAIGVILVAAAIWVAIPRTSRFSLAGAVLIGLAATFPYENPIRAFTPSFVASLVVVLIVVGTGEAARVGAEMRNSPGSPERDAVQTATRR